MPATDNSKKLATPSKRIDNDMRDANWQKLTEAITFILSDEETPAFIHNGLVDFVFSICDSVNVHVASASVVGVALNLAVEKVLTGNSLRK